MPKTCTSCGETYPDSMVFCPKDGTSLRLDAAGGDLIGTVIRDTYLIEKELGEGGMGKVYVASHVRLPQKAAIKVLHADMVKDAGAVARFNREAASAVRIEHDRVARVYDYGETSDGLAYIAMEFVPGKSLRSLIDDSRRLPPTRAANIAYQVAEGLEAAHKLTIVHRDLKPDNILVITDEEGADRCKVVDFGIAKVTNDAGTQLTQMGMLVGTPEFMSPEQVLGEPLDGRSDVYALALVTYEMFTGELPFEGNTPERKLTARLIQDPRPLAEAAPDVDWPEELQAAFDRALVREPEARTASALAFGDEVVNAVEAWTGMSVLRQRTPLSTTAVMGYPGEVTGALPRPTATATRTPSPTRGASTPARAVATPPSAATPGAGTSASKAAIPEPSPKKTPIAAIAAAVVVLAAVGGYLAFGRGSSATVGPEASAAIPPATSPTNGSATPDSISKQVSTSSPNGSPGTDAARRNEVAAKGAPAGPSTTAPTVSAPSAPTVSAPAGVSAADAAEAQRALSGIRETLNSAPEGQEAVVSKRVIPQLKALLPRLGNATDSTWAYLTLVNAHGLADEPTLACQPLREAKRLAATDLQRQAVRTFSDALTCAP